MEMIAMSTSVQPGTNRTHAYLLANKNAVIFGAAGAVGKAVASEFSAQGATVFLTGRHLDGIEQLTAEIRAAGGTAHGHQVDALNEQEVIAYLEHVKRDGASVDVSVNLTGQRVHEFSHGRNTLDLPLEHFMVPLTQLVPAQFITARAAARHMVEQRSGVILFITAPPGRGLANVSAIGAAYGAMEALTRCLAVDLGPSGVRVVGIMSGAMIDTTTIQQSLENRSRQMSVPKEQLVTSLMQSTLLKRLPTAADTARLAAFLVSDAAPTITGAIVNASSGSVID